MRFDRRHAAGSVPLPPDRPMDPFELENFAIACTEDSTGLDHVRERLLERKPRVIDLVRECIDGFTAERKCLEPWCKWCTRSILL